MKKSLIIMFMILAVASFAAAQVNVGAATQDVLGAHLNYGRGCAACHAPHSGAWGNGANKSGDTVSGQAILWGQDTGNLYGQTITTAGGTVEVLPTAAEFVADTQPDVKGLLTCLSCHDGNWAEGAMMKDAVYETLPGTYGKWNTIPTLLGNDGDGAGNYIANHPVGLNATVACGGQWNWDCTETNGKIIMNGTNSAQFAEELRLLRVPQRLQQHRCGYLHELPQPARHEHGQRHCLEERACRLTTTRRCSSSAPPTTRLAAQQDRTRPRNSAVNAMVERPTSRTVKDNSARSSSLFAVYHEGREKTSPLFF